MNTLDSAEIAKFNEHATQWWDPEGPLHTLHDINPIRVEFIKQQLGHCQHLEILDLGCGGGILSEALAATGANVTGIDKAESAIIVAREHAQQQTLSINYIYTGSDELVKTHMGHFDVVCCLELLEHVTNFDKIIEECAALTKPGGTLFFSTINRTWQAYLQAILGAEFLLGLIPQHTHHYEKFIKPSELDRIARRANLELINLKGLAYHPFTHQASLTDNVKVNYLCSYRKSPLPVGEGVIPF